MKIYTERLEGNVVQENVEIVELTFDTRQKSRFRATLANGHDIGADLPRTRHFKARLPYIATQEGDVLRVDAKAEKTHESRSTKQL